jgi:hypothetical protein
MHRRNHDGHVKDTAMETLDRCRSMLSDIDQLSLRFRPKSDEAITLFSRAMELVPALDATQIAGLRTAVEQNLAFKLMYLSVLAAERAMKTRDPVWIRAALTGHIVEGFRIDPRENYLRLYAIEYAAHRASIDHMEILRGLDPLLDTFTRRNFAVVFSARNGETALRLADLTLETLPDGEVRFAPAKRP